MYFENLREGKMDPNTSKKKTNFLLKRLIKVEKQTKKTTDITALENHVEIVK